MANDIFVPRDSADIARLIAEYPLAWIVSMGAEGSAATVLPLLAETDAAGEVVALFGHFGKSNPQVALLERQARALILFQGPHAYVPARLVSNPTWGPTWNYAVARFDVEIAFVPEETPASVERLAAALEKDRPEPWTPAQMDERREQLLRHIVAFRARVTGTHARFKLGQDESAQTFDEIVAGLDDRALADWMTHAVRGTALGE
ncbi:MAG: FMN-binding negative transcriptional regulator [Sphingomonadaceae bacterium]|nr:FMN-binding negative transcriptional regulator [Sphingomonadaceae bacterium]